MIACTLTVTGSVFGPKHNGPISLVFYCFSVSFANFYVGACYGLSIICPREKLH